MLCSEGFSTANTEVHACTHRRPAAGYWPRSSRLPRSGNKLPLAFLQATAGTASPRSPRSLKGQTQEKNTGTDGVGEPDNSQRPVPGDTSLCHNDSLTEYQTHGEGLEVDRIVNPHVHLRAETITWTQHLVGEQTAAF